MKAKLVNISHSPVTSGTCKFELREEGYNREPGALLATLANTDSDIAGEILKAWNSHYELLELADAIAAQDPITFGKDCDLPYRQLAALVNNYQEKARQAIQNATKQVEIHS